VLFMVSPVLSDSVAHEPVTQNFGHPPALASGCVFRIRNGSSGSINVTALAGGITGSTYGSYTNTGSSLTLINGQYAELWSNGSTWVLK
ncbi:hypothetical protein N0543_26650, partial [Pseudomonas aeruginosa]|nr:hypothetical protein [Pseudomonas aeruginosa]